MADQHATPQQLILALDDLVSAQQQLLTAYRTGSHRTADSALTRLPKARARVEELRAQQAPEDTINQWVRDMLHTANKNLQDAMRANRNPSVGKMLARAAEELAGAYSMVAGLTQK